MNVPMSLDAKQLFSLIALLKDPVALYSGKEFFIQFANDQMLRLWGAFGSAIGNPLDRIVPAVDNQNLLNILNEIWESGNDYKAENIPVKYSDVEGDEWNFFDMEFLAIKDEQKNVTSILHIAIGSARHETANTALQTKLSAFQSMLPNVDRHQPSVSSAKLSEERDLLIESFLASKAEAELERDRVKQFFMQAPAGICVLDGDHFVFELINPQYQQFFPGRTLLGKPLVNALPELEGSPIEEILKRVYKTGETYEGKEQYVPLALETGGPVEDRYFNFIYQARRNAAHQIDGVLVFVIEVTENVLNRRMIEEKERGLRSMIMNSHYGLMILRGRDCLIEIANEQIANLWQKSLQEITGRKLLDVLPGLVDQPFPDLLKNVFDTGVPYSQEEEVFYLSSAEGEVKKYVSFFYDPLTNAEGKITGIIVACEDITERVRSEQLLHDSYEEQQSLNEELTASNEELANLNEEMAATNEELVATNEELVKAQASLHDLVEELAESKTKMAAIVESAPFPIGVYEGKEMRISLANRSIMEVWGKGFDVVGKTYSEVLPELENQAIYEQLDHVFTTGVAFHAKNQRVDLVIDEKLRPFYFNYSFTPLADRSGNIYGVMNTAADVTDLVIAKQKIEKSERDLNNIILQSPVAMCFLSGPDHVITVANPSMVEIWGKPIDEVMNKPVFEALPDATEQGLEQVMADVFYKGKTFRADELPVNLIRNGQPDTVYQNFVYEPFRDSNGDIVGVIAITTNVTEQVLARKKIEQSEAELREVKRRLEAELEVGKEIQRQKDSFIGIASHELKTPLTSLTAIVQVANMKLKNSDDPFLAGAMEKAGLQIKRMSSLISGFLNISRFESGRMIIVPQKFDLVGLIKEVTGEVSLTCSTHTVHFTCPAAIYLEADRDKINSVISNLVNNAIKYSPVRRDIFIGCEVVGKEVQVTVEDGGIGIRKKDQEKVFERYFRVEADHTQHISGFGIGLYLSAEIIRRHGGRIWVDSEIGKGSKFRFTIPL